MLRFRPILMTTMAALFGALPLAFGTGTGSELRRPLGHHHRRGLILSQVLTLYTTPVVYLFLDRARLRVKTESMASSELRLRRPARRLKRTETMLVRQKIMIILQRKKLGFSLRLAAAGLSLMLWAAWFGPKYHPPSAQRRQPRRPQPSTRSATQLNANEGWTVAQPADAKLRGKWWRSSTIPS